MREARERELRILAESRIGADPRYVQNVVDFLWSKLLDRKLQSAPSLPVLEQQRLNTLAALYS